MASNKELKRLILDYCDMTYVQPGGFFDSISARPLKLTEIVHRCGMAGFRTEAIRAQLAELCEDGWLLNYSFTEDDIQFFPSWRWDAHRSKINSQASKYDLQFPLTSPV